MTVFVTSIISSQEWIRLAEAAQQAFPNEVSQGRDNAPILIIGGSSASQKQPEGEPESP